jgi:iron complex outermembrane recepter protein
MLKKLFIAGFFFTNPFFIFAQNENNERIDTLPEVNVKNAWANENTPITFKNLSKESLEKFDFGQDLPFILQSTPSVVASSDAGTGIGYTGFRIRGNDPTRVNVTINGIPYNDPESHSVYWVDLPDIFSSTENIQIQRGVGTSTNGAGAFGSSINLNTNVLKQNREANIKFGIGSFGTKRMTVMLNSGLKNGFAAEFKISKINSNGYIDRASSDLLSGDIGLTWVGKKNSFRVNIIDGGERTYQAWNGLPIQFLDSKRTYNSAGTERQSSPYENQVDRYQQTHFQLFYKHEFNQRSNLNFAFYATFGKGFYEEYKGNTSVKKYGLQTKDTINAVQRRWLKNALYGVVFGYHYEKNIYDFTVGGGFNRYDGLHFGEVIWNSKKLVALNNHRWYEDNAVKYDGNIYAKLTKKWNTKLLSYLDLQFRNIDYSTIGNDQYFSDISQKVYLPFFNPKAGFSYLINSKTTSYVSFGIANREPNRDDYVQSSEFNRPKSEQLRNIEIGVKRQEKNWFLQTNLYYMGYKNQLVLTGEINDIGAYNRVNVPKSYRAGIEFDATAKFHHLTVNGNLTLSQNKILNFEEFIDNWDSLYQEKINLGKTDIAFSPNTIAALNLTYDFSKNIQVFLNNKLVGKQFLDNSSSSVASLPSYFSNDLIVFYQFQFKNKIKSSVSFLINNILNQKYSSNGWSYHYISDGFDPTSSNPYSVKDGKTFRDIGLFPQAGRNYMLNFTIKF